MLCHLGVKRSDSRRDERSAVALLLTLWVQRSAAEGAAQCIYSLMKWVRGVVHGRPMEWRRKRREDHGVRAGWWREEWLWWLKDDGERRSQTALLSLPAGWRMEEEMRASFPLQRAAAREDKWALSRETPPPHSDHYQHILFNVFCSSSETKEKKSDWFIPQSRQELWARGRTREVQLLLMWFEICPFIINQYWSQCCFLQILTTF